MNKQRGLYLPQLSAKRLTRRRLMQVAGIGAAGAIGAAYLGCGGDNKEEALPTLSAGTTPETTTKPVRGGSITIAIGSAFDSFDPHVSGGIYAKWAMMALYDGPLADELDENNNLVLVPHLAKSWELPDQLSLIMNWREAVRFQDGTDFNAAAAKAYFDNVLNPETKSIHAAELKALDRVENSNDLTSTLFLKEADAQFIYYMNDATAAMPSPAAVQKWGSDYGTHPVGTGAFILKGQQPGASYEFERNPTHWRPDQPYLDGYKCRVIPDKAVAAAALKAGEVDYAEQSELDVQDILSFQQDSDFDVLVEGCDSLMQIWIYNERPPGNNVHLRRAISYAINRQEFVDKYNGLAFVSTGPMPKHSAYENPSEPDPEYNPEKAKEELKAAGYEDGITIKMKAIGDPLVQSDVELLAAQLSQVGIKVQPEFGSAASAAATLANGDYETAFGSWVTTDVGDLQYAFRLLYHSTGYFNGGSIKDPEMDSLIDQASAEPDSKKRRELYWQVMRIINENAYMLYLIGRPIIKVVRKGIHGFNTTYNPFVLASDKEARKLWRE